MAFATAEIMGNRRQRSGGLWRWRNDIEMLRQAGFSFAMENAGRRSSQRQNTGLAPITVKAYWSDR